MSEEPDAAVICAAEWQAAVDCVSGDQGGCGGGACVDTSTFELRFEPDMANEFRQQIAAGPPMPPDEGFCEMADERMCAYHENVLVSCYHSAFVYGFHCVLPHALGFLPVLIPDRLVLFRNIRAVVAKKKH